MPEDSTYGYARIRAKQSLFASILQHVEVHLHPIAPFLRNPCPFPPWYHRCCGPFFLDAQPETRYGLDC